MPLKPNIFDFINFREYLKAYLLYLRLKNPAFRFQTLVEKYGLNSRSHFIDITKGRKLTKRFLANYQAICELTANEADYFAALVGYEQAKTDASKIGYFNNILRLSPNIETVKLENEAYRYFSKWYYPVMLSVLDLHKHEQDHLKLAKQFKPAISGVQARQAITVLTELNFIQWNNDRKEWRINHKFLKCTDSARVVALKSFHEAMQQMGLQAYKTDFDNQSFSTLTLGISAKTRSAIEQMVIDLRKTIMEKAKADMRPEVVVQVNFQVFNVSRIAGNDAFPAEGL